MVTYHETKIMTNKLHGSGSCIHPKTCNQSPPCRRGEVYENAVDTHRLYENQWHVIYQYKRREQLKEPFM